MLEPELPPEDPEDEELTAAQLDEEHFVPDEPIKRKHQVYVPKAGECRVCLLPAKCRMVVEMMLRANISLRECKEFIVFWSGKHREIQFSVSHMAIHRHQTSEHFVMTPAVEQKDAPEYGSIQLFVKEMFKRYQKSKKNYIPTHREMVELFTMEARLADLESKRNDDAYLRELMATAAPRAEDTDGIPGDDREAKSEAHTSS